jgi:hypothetical protein
MNKAYMAFWTCKGTFGKTSGLKSKVVNWIYVMVFRPMLNYGSRVCGGLGLRKVRRAGLSRLQRLATQAITLTMRTAATAVMDTPLHFL